MIFASRRLIVIHLLACSAIISGCSYKYDLHLEGQIVRGKKQTPVEGAKITLFAGSEEYETCESNRNGRWKLRHALDESDFESTQNGKKRLRTETEFPLSIRIETKDDTIVIICPNVAIPESDRDIHAFVLAVLNAENAE
ncbi:MAG: hypothetical protein ACKVT0_13910 [Planctomycetaceae bacterium]